MKFTKEEFDKMVEEAYKEKPKSNKEALTKAIEKIKSKKVGLNDNRS